MNDGRWYPTNTTLANGDVLVISGTTDNISSKNTLPQIWQTASESWRDLIGAQQLPPHGTDNSDEGLYPRMFLVADGRLFKAGVQRETWFLDTSGAGGWTQGPSSNFGFRGYGSTVMYDQGKILIVGGSDPPTASAEVIDLNEPTPAWRSVGSMAFARRHVIATILADGKVIVTCGTSSPGFNVANQAVLAAEIWDPETEMWSTMATMQVKRLYHSTAILLPDARVLIAGGGRPAPEGEVENPDFEIYSPPYLFNGSRPTITSAPTIVNYGETFFVETPDAASITQVNLIRLGSVTHSFDSNQRINKLSFSQAPGGLNVTAPANGNLAPPGHYMLFILNADGVPAVAPIIQLIALPPGQGLVFRVERSTGNVFADGAFTSAGADLAERIYVSEPVEPGDVVELDPDKPHHYRKARRASNHLIAGVISTEPGFILGNRNQLLVVSGQLLENEKDERPMLALLGRVPVKATTENGPIRAGDLLIVSNKPGYAMLCDEMKGCDGVIGKALSPLDSGEGLIVVLVTSH